MSVRTRAVSIGTTVALSGAAFFVGTASTAGAATATFTCRGITGDVAGQVAGANKSSKELLDLLASLGGSAELSLPVQITTNVPSSIKTGPDPITAEFDYDITLPDSLLASARDLLGVSTIQVTNASYSIDVSGASTTTLTGTNPSITLNIASPPVKVQQRITGEVDVSNSGLIQYRAGETRLSIVVNGTVAGAATVGTLTVSCTTSGLLASTSVSPPGAPNITTTPLIRNVTAGSEDQVVIDDGTLVVPDEGNPILWDSLRIVDEPSAGTARIDNGDLLYTAPGVNGSYDVSYEVCAAAKDVEGQPGTDEVQTFTFADTTYYLRSFNAHPKSFTLVFDGQETAPIETSRAEFLGIPVPVNLNDPGAELIHNLGGQFMIPSAAKVQAALAKLPNIGAGNVTVTGGPTRTGDLTVPYTITFGGDLAEKDVAQITIGQWNTWLPQDALAVILGAAGGLGGGGDAPPPPTYDQSIQQYFAGTISIETMFDQFGARAQADLLGGINISDLLTTLTALFPKTPALATATAGEDAIEPGNTGPLCSTGVVQYVVTGGTAATEGDSVAGTQTTAAAASTESTTTAAAAQGATAVSSGNPGFTG